MFYQSVQSALFAFVCGLVAGIIPNHKSNIHPLLLGVIFGILFTKIVLGDYDRGYQWSFLDPVFAGVTGSFGALGAWMSTKAFPKIRPS